MQLWVLLGRCSSCGTLRLMSCFICWVPMFAYVCGKLLPLKCTRRSISWGAQAYFWRPCVATGHPGCTHLMHFWMSAGEVSARVPPGKAATTTSLMRLRDDPRYANCEEGTHTFTRTAMSAMLL